ncbi:unnamed protein product [Orchesella dallaii]|uniref:Bromo domain-containing protein n=1 Tax=Orchesella dallaii TaxID=48710 RepID=A0ABP1RAJ6_9HEXA
MMAEHQQGKSRLSEPNDYQQQHGKSSRTSAGLFLTLPNNFSPSSLSPTGGNGRNSGSPAPLTPPQSKGISRSSPSHNYSWEDLRRLFLISLEKMYMLEPESLPFRQPVDPELLGISDYYDIIRKPMDLQTIRNKMNTGKYTDPFAYVDDVLRMLDNAWVYNREGSKVHQYCSKLADVFVKEVNTVLNHLGVREGRSNCFQFNSDVINCHGRPVCLIFKGVGYWKDTSRNIEYNLCESCYGKQNQGILTPVTSDSVPVTPDVIPNTPNHQKHPSRSSSQSSSPRGSISSQSSACASFEFVINSCRGAYSPAAEYHKSHMRDAEMSRQLVLREFLRMLLGNDTTEETKRNVFKMLSANAKLHGEFIEYVKRRKGISSSQHQGCSVVIGESFTTKDLDKLVEKLKGLQVTKPVNKCTASAAASSDDAISVCSSDKENEEERRNSEHALALLDLSLESAGEEKEEENHHQESL